MLLSSHFLTKLAVTLFMQFVRPSVFVNSLPLIKIKVEGMTELQNHPFHDSKYSTVGWKEDGREMAEHLDHPFLKLKFLTLHFLKNFCCPATYIVPRTVSIY